MRLDCILISQKRRSAKSQKKDGLIHTWRDLHRKKAASMKMAVESLSHHDRRISDPFRNTWRMCTHSETLGWREMRRPMATLLFSPWEDLLQERSINTLNDFLFRAFHWWLPQEQLRRPCNPCNAACIMQLEAPLGSECDPTTFGILDTVKKMNQQERNAMERRAGECWSCQKEALHAVLQMFNQDACPQANARGDIISLVKLEKMLVKRVGALWAELVLLLGSP